MDSDQLRRSRYRAPRSGERSAVRAAQSGPGRTGLAHPDGCLDAGALVHGRRVRAGVQPHSHDHRDEHDQVLEQVKLGARDPLLDDARRHRGTRRGSDL